MTNLYNYIPRHPMSIQVGSNGISISGIYKFEIDVERCVANYSIWIDTVQAEPLLPKKDTVMLTPMEITQQAILHMPDMDITCNLTKISYVSRRHGYVVELNCLIDPKHVAKFKYIEPGKESKKEVDRFDLMEIEE